METQRTYFVTCLLLLLLLFTLFLLSGYGEKRESIQLDLEGRHFSVQLSTYEVAIYIVPTLLAFTVFCGAMGRIQGWVVLPEILKRILAYLFSAGILLQCISFNLRRGEVGEDFPTHQAVRWIMFVGVNLVTLPVLFQLFGFARRGNRGKSSSAETPAKEIAGENAMKAAMIYAISGLLLMFGVLLRTYTWRPPWLDEHVVGMTTIWAGLYTWPLAAAVAATALFLAALQSSVRFPERVKLIGAVAFLLGGGVFLSSFYVELLQERPWRGSMLWTTAAGLVVLLSALLLNLIGMIRKKDPMIDEVGSNSV